MPSTSRSQVGVGGDEARDLGQGEDEDEVEEELERQDLAVGLELSRRLLVGQVSRRTRPLA